MDASPTSGLASPATSAVHAAQESSVPGDNAGHGVDPVVAFITGFAIIMLASVLNAAGLNLTKLDHVGVSEALLREDHHTLVTTGTNE